ncbi:MAG: hypothetical protein VB144_11750 [Clostridia bacterium]|nr:hypothetical protein [Clostridia bacterium]
MKNLATRRSEAWTEHGRDLYCPHSPDCKPCSTECCAHYNPDTNECIHVEAAQAQVRAAEALERLVTARNEPEDLRIELEVAKEMIRVLEADNHEIRLRNVELARLAGKGA